MVDARCTIFKNILSKEAHYLTVDQALHRIKTGKSKVLVEEIRSQIDKERQDALKGNLPSVCFSGYFVERKDEKIITHTGFIVLDFDNVFEVEEKKKELSAIIYTYACWVSPRNNGLKVLVKIADGSKHREHFAALQEVYSGCDKSGKNEARVCYESYDPDLFINKESAVFTKYEVIRKYEEKKTIDDEEKVFDNIVKWLSNRGDAFISGERNIFIFKLGSACCRFGLPEQSCIYLSIKNFEVGTNKFSEIECQRTIESAYRSNKSLFGSAHFDKDVLVDKVSRFEVTITPEMLDESIRPKDVIFGEDVKAEVFSVYDNGYQLADPIGIPSIDELFKLKKGEITLLSGYGNYGKSTWLSWFLLLRSITFGEKFAFFSPEENATEFYHNMTEMLIGGDCTPNNPNRVNKNEYEIAYDFISSHFFFVYPKELAPTPEYIKERFLELIIKEKVNGVIIDPFNQLTNDYRGIGGGRSDKYLETFLSDWSRFTQTNNVYGLIVAHPKLAKKDARGNYPCPDVFEIADGAMWNNKMDNILIYDRPEHQTNPQGDICELHSKKIRRQKIVGRKGFTSFNFKRSIRRYTFNNVDPMENAIEKSKYYVVPKKAGKTIDLFEKQMANISIDDDNPF